MWGPDAPPLDPNSAVRQFLVAVAGFVTVGFIIKAITPDPPAIRREYPFDGLIKELGGLEENKVCVLHLWNYISLILCRRDQRPMTLSIRNIRKFIAY